MLILKN